jgi:molecular chaperone DnaJ
MDLYQVLGVRRGATLAEIRRAYQKHARRLHPDLNPGDPVASQRFQEVSRAFEVLSDPQRRAQYDRGDVAPPAPRPPEVRFAGFDFSADVHAGGVGFQQIFGGVLRAGTADPEGATRGEDLEQSARITFEESFRGAARRVHLVRLDQCPACGGMGAIPTPPMPCPSCNGAGETRARRGRMIFSRHCRDCGSSGVIARRPCVQCAGDGRVMRTQGVEVAIPAGASNGFRVVLPGLGNAGRRGGAPGDFVLVLHVDAHPLFRRQGDDLFCEIPVTITEAALGAHVDVPTPDGRVTIEVPAGTQSGQRFRLRKRGMPRTGGPGRGDLYVEARVWVPTVRDDASRELLREFARRNAEDPRRDLIGRLAPAASAVKAR